MEKMKILFISRAYPPIIGGIENQNFELGQWLGKIAEVKIIANKKGKRFLPFFLPYAKLKILFLMPKYDALLLGDGVLGILGWISKILFKKPVICVTHGLDLTYKNDFYQKFCAKIFLKKLDKIIAVSRETAKIALQKGIAPEKVVFIPNGIDTAKFFCNHQRNALMEILKEEIENKKFIVTSGRLARRKGVAWFIENVLPKLPENVIYIVAGDGPDKENIQNSIQRNKMQARVRLLGQINNKTRDIILSACDIFVQPNIKVIGDMEGFGLSVIEAACCGLPVVASRLEGLQDAIKEEQDGFLIEPYDIDGYVQKINTLLNDGEFRNEFGKKARKFVIENYDWEKIAQRYLREIEKTVNK